MLRVLLSPRLIGLHLLALVATTAAGWLGLWQYDAWQTTRDTQAISLADAPPKPLETVMTSDDPYPGNAVGQPVSFAGQWVGEATLLLADRELGGRSGYWVVTPAAVCRDRCDTRPAVPVVRGWVPRRSDLPVAPTGRVRVTGWLQPPEGSGIPDPNPRDDVLAELRIADVLQRVDQDLFGAYVIAETMSSTTKGTDAAAGLESVTPASLPEPERFTALRNLLYAFEWWVFGVFALFLWWRWCTDVVRAGHSKSASQSGSQSAFPSGPGSGSWPRRAEDPTAAEVASNS